MRAPTQYGPALYRVVYADDRRGSVRTLTSVFYLLEAAQRYGGWKSGHEPVRVVPVPGTQYRGTYGGATYEWHSHDDHPIEDYASAGAPRLIALELRSPVQS